MQEQRPPRCSGENDTQLSTYGTALAHEGGRVLLLSRLHMYQVSQRTPHD